MTIFEKIKQMTVEEMAEKIDNNISNDYYTPWEEWFDKKYCKNCKPILEYIPAWHREVEVAPCENLHKCSFFPDSSEMPNTKEIILKWLESESEKII